MNARLKLTLIVLPLLCVGFAFYFHRPRPHVTGYVAPAKFGDFSATPKSELLESAIVKGDVGAVRRLLDSGVSPNSYTSEEKPALELAAELGKLTIVQILLDRGGNVNLSDSWEGTALVGAAFNGQADVVKLLINRGANVNVNADGATAVGYAAQALSESKDAAEHRRYEEVVNALRNAGAREL